VLRYFHAFFAAKVQVLSSFFKLDQVLTLFVVLQDLLNYLSKKGSFMERITLTVGFIPEDWSGSSDGGKLIMPGDPDHSKTSEVALEISDDGFLNLSTNEMIDGEMAAIYRGICDLTKHLSDDKYVTPLSVVKNVYELCLDEAEGFSSNIQHSEEEGICDFENKRSKYNTSFYFKYCVEDGDSIECEKLYVVRSNKRD
jgi:hypothetical protein